MKRTPPKSSRCLGLLEMGHMGEVPVRVVAANLQAVMGLDVDVLSPLKVPEEAFRMHRRQYDAGIILQYLAKRSFPRHLRILALTTVDLCSPVLTYVYGEADIGGKVAVVSSFRLRANEDGSMVPVDRYYERLAKVALHEMAHTFSVYHCEDPKCLMHFSARAHHLDEVEILFCQRCAFLLRENLKHLHSGALDRPYLPPFDRIG